MKTDRYRIQRLVEQAGVIAAAKADFIASQGFPSEKAALDRLNEAINFNTELASAALNVVLADDA